MYVIGVKSLFVILLVGLFTGMVLGFQGYYTLVKFGSEGLLGAAVALSLVRELGPVLCAIMVIGRAGSSMAAELGVMRITDQIDALEVMDIRPMSFLVSPRLAASLICFPLLTAIFDVIGIIGGYLTGVALLGINSGVYFYRIDATVDMADIMGGFYKSILFALLVAIVCCYQGFFTHLRRGRGGSRRSEQLHDLGGGALLRSGAHRRLRHDLVPSVRNLNGDKQGDGRQGLGHSAGRSPGGIREQRGARRHQHRSARGKDLRDPGRLRLRQVHPAAHILGLNTPTRGRILLGGTRPLSGKKNPNSGASGGEWGCSSKMGPCWAP